jgi:glutamate synthase (NADPH/NADH) small chain
MTEGKAFLKVERKDPDYRPVAERIRDFEPVEIPLAGDDVRLQASRCMDCGTPFCHAAQSGCPLANAIPEFNEHVWRGRWDDALDILLHTNCFPEFTGRVCPALCEGACVLGLIRRPVNVCKIEMAIAEYGFRQGRIKANPPRMRRKERVAVVGSGPSGLAAAWVLNRAGFGVTVHEKNRRPGGLMRYGIPDFKLEKRVLDRRLDLMRAEGITFECGVEVGRDVSSRFLRDRFNAVILACGAEAPRDLAVPGRRLEGIHFAVPYLAQQNMIVGGEPVDEGKLISAAGRNVVVIGGGDTGADCIGTARRQGAKQIVQLEILPEPPPCRSESTPWPQWPMMRRDSSSHKEGCVRRWCVDTREFLGEGGHVRGIRCVEVEWLNDGGRMKPVEKPGSGFTLDAELVLLAMGFVGPANDALLEQFGVEKDPRGFIRRDARHMTSVEGVFAAGDVHRGASLVVRAIADGMRTAENAMAYLGVDTSF